MTPLFKKITLLSMLLFTGCSLDLTDIFTPDPPASLAILSASPNPFTDTLQIVYNVSSADKFSNLSIVIVDRAGNDVATALHTAPVNGQHAITWNGRDERNKKVGGGFYFVEMRGWYSNDRSVSRVMIFREGE